MVKILLDTHMYHATMSVAEECYKAADLGFEYIELSPRADFHEWHHYPKVNDADIRTVKKAMAESGVRIETFNPVFNWSSPDEWTRRMHVRNFRRLLQIANDLEVPMIATELSGDPNRPTECEWAFYASIEELTPDFEKYGISCTVEAHPYDFVETNARCVDIVRGVNKDWFNYEFCCAHAFHLGEGSTDLRSMLAYAGDKLAHVHVADVYNHRANIGNRYIVNPPGVDARVHAHNEIGNGEVPWDQVFGYLREVAYDGRLAVSVFGWEERADEIHVAMRERIEREFASA